MRELLRTLDIEPEVESMRQELETTGSEAKQEDLKRLKVLEGLPAVRHQARVDDLDVPPVLPPDLRPLVPLTAALRDPDLNDLYRRVINRNNRLKRLLELRRLDIIVRNESACCRKPSTRCSTTAAAARP